MTLALPAESHIVVVDSRPRDYRHLTALAEECAWHVHFLTTARAAIMFVRRARANLWLINTRMPEMSGLELYALLREQVPGDTAFLIADQYDVEEERRACQQGATLYLCKDASRALDCRALLQLPAVHESRAGPQANESIVPRLDRSPAHYLRGGRAAADPVVLPFTAGPFK